MIPGVDRQPVKKLPKPNQSMWPFNDWSSAITSLGSILAALLPKEGTASSRVIGDPPEDAMARAVRSV
jgi:hypothetical protein